jgi:hypothetical protein
VGRRTQPCSLTSLSWGALGCAQLYKASEKGDVEAVKLLLARNVDVNKAYKVRERVWTAKTAWEAVEYGEATWYGGDSRAL